MKVFYDKYIGQSIVSVLTCVVSQLKMKYFACIVFVSSKKKIPKIRYKNNTSNFFSFSIDDIKTHNEIDKINRKCQNIQANYKKK